MNQEKQSPSALQALMRRASKLEAKDREVEAGQIYDEAVRQFGEVADSEVAEQVAWALIRKGLALQMKQPETAIAAWEEVDRRFGGRTEAAIVGSVAFAILSKGFLFDADSRPDLALAAFDEVVTRFGNTDDPLVADNVAWALWNRSYLLEKGGVTSRNESEMKNTLSSQVALALGEIGEKLTEVDHPLDAKQAHEQIIYWFADREEKEIIGIVAKARLERSTQPCA